MNMEQIRFDMHMVIINLLLSCNGTIYGGAVRDIILRKHVEKKFKKKNSGISREEYIKLYNDRNYQKELVDRLLIPNDIDAYVDIIEYEKLMSVLDDSGFTTKEEVCENYPTESEFYTHIRLEIKSCSLKHVIHKIKSNLPKHLSFLFEDDSLVKKYKVFTDMKPLYVDLFLLDDGDKTNDPFEFMCNNLIWNKHGFSVSKKLCENNNPFYNEIQKNQIIEQIHNKIAVIPLYPKMKKYGCIHNLRVKKIIEKGYTIEGFANFSYINDNSYNGHCIICHDKFSKKHYKMKCCDARFHTHCIVDMYNSGTTNRCIMCMKSLNNFENDLIIFSKITE
jgi:hypothetical protein